MLTICYKDWLFHYFITSWTFTQIEMTVINPLSIFLFPQLVVLYRFVLTRGSQLNKYIPQGEQPHQKKLLDINWYLIDSDPQLQLIFPTKPFLSYKRNPGIHDHLVHTRFSTQERKEERRGKRKDPKETSTKLRTNSLSITALCRQLHYGRNNILNVLIRGKVKWHMYRQYQDN